MAASDGGGISEDEYMFYIVVALPTAALRLAAFKVGTDDSLIKNGEPCDLTDATHNLHTLIIATLTQTRRCQWDGNNSINTNEETTGQQLRGNHTPHLITNLGMVLIFQGIDKTGCLGMRLVKVESRSTFNRNLAPE